MTDQLKQLSEAATQGVWVSARDAATHGPPHPAAEKLTMLSIPAACALFEEHMRLRDARGNISEEDAAALIQWGNEIIDMGRDVGRRFL